MGYGYTHLFITYENGFVRRGLFGELLRILPRIDHDAARLIGFGSVAVASLLAYLAFVRRPFTDTSGALVLAFLLAGCGMLPHLAFISGFLDVQLFIVAMLNLLGLAILRGPTSRLAATLALTVVGLLIHESYLLLFYPAVLLIVLARQPSVRGFSLLFWFTQTAVMVAFVAIVLVGESPLDPKEALARAAQRTDMMLMPEVFHVLSYDLTQQWRYMTSQLSLRDLVGQVAAIVTALPYLIALWIIARRAFTETGFAAVLPLPERSWRILLATLPFAPLLLAFFGHDVMRWVSAVCINGTLFAAFQVSRGMEESRSRDLVDRVAREPWFVASFLLTLVVGPFGAVAGNRLVAKLAALLGT